MGLIRLIMHALFSNLTCRPEIDMSMIVFLHTFWRVTSASQEKLRNVSIISPEFEIMCDILLCLRCRWEVKGYTSIIMMYVR